MNRISFIEEEVTNALQGEGILSYVVPGQTQFLYPGYNSVQLVFSDGSVVEHAERILQDLQKRIEREHDLAFIYSVRAVWTLDSIGESEELRTADGSVTAASVIPVRLKSGTRSVMAHVIITWQAYQTLSRLAGRTFSMTEVADVISRDMLARGGTSAWDPLKQPTVEINSSAALYVSRLLRKAA